MGDEQDSVAGWGSGAMSIQGAQSSRDGPGRTVPVDFLPA